MIAATSSADQRRAALKLPRTCDSGEVSNKVKLPKTTKITGIFETGTALAIEYLTFGEAGDLAPTSRRGGARNRADRESDSLTVGHVANLMAAAKHAAVIGLTFTRMITIHWQAAGVALEQMAKATGRFIELLTKALKRKGSGTAWLWVHEGGVLEGGHCHLLAHVPARLVKFVTGSQKRWLRRITARPYRSDVICSKPIGGRLELEIGNPDLHAQNLGEALGYVLKGATDVAGAQFVLARLKPGGRVVGKRCGTSQNIGSKARSSSERAKGPAAQLEQVRSQHS